MQLQLKTFTIVLLFIATYSFAQTGIGTSTPHASAKLDVTSTNKGFLPPRVTLTSATDATTIPSPAEGLLVYNLGSVGLQSGYYYWNGANWATMATGTTAGNAVVAGDLVKIYGETHSKANNKIGNATTGFGFTVPVSGRYLFDFTSAATTLYGGTNTIFFTVRQGTTVLASDTQSSYNNNVHVEYNGKLEVNLQAGVSYNVYNYATSGSFEASDYDRVYYKMVAGNLPVNQHVADRNFQLNNNFLSNDGDNEGIRIDNSGNVGIGNNAPTAKLDVTGTLEVSGKATLRDLVDIGTGIGDEGGEFHFAIPATNTTLQTRVKVDVWQNRLRFFEGSTNAKGVHIDLSKAPNNASGELIWKASGLVNRGVDVTLGNLKARIAATGNISLQISTVSGTYSVYGSGVHVFTSNLGSATIDGAAPKTISTTPVYLLAGNTFPTAGGTDTWNIMDTSNSIAWRVTMILGAGVNNNLITIERLF